MRRKIGLSATDVISVEDTNRKTCPGQSHSLEANVEYIKVLLLTLSKMCVPSRNPAMTRYLLIITFANPHHYSGIRSEITFPRI